jgi:hypothetical protein
MAAILLTQKYFVSDCLVAMADDRRKCCGVENIIEIIGISLSMKAEEACEK